MLIYDGDCGFCTQVALQARLRLRICIQPWQEADLGALGLTVEQCQAAVQWVQDPGSGQSGGAAVASALEHSPWPWSYVGATLRSPFMVPAVDALYRAIASRRQLVSQCTPSSA